VVLDKDEKKAATLLQQLNAIRNARGRQTPAAGQQEEGAARQEAGPGAGVEGQVRGAGRVTWQQAAVDRLLVCRSEVWRHGRSS